MKNGKIFGIGISDIHFGAHSPKRLKNELYGVFLKYVRVNAELLDIIVFVGDIFDKKLNFDEESGRLLISFFDELHEICLENDIQIRIIRGTLSHDLLNQVDVFKHYVHEGGIVEIFKENTTVTEFEIGDDVINFMYIPEEYPKDTELYLNDIYNQMEEYQPSMVFLHGTFDFVAFESQKIMSERPIKTAPIFDANKMISYNPGHIVAGHIHAPYSHKGTITYCNSFSRNAHGEEKKKGFISFLLDPKTNDVEVTRIYNELAPRFVTLDLNELFGGLDLPLEEKVLALNKAKERYENVRFIDSTETEEVDAALLKAAFRTDDNIKIKTKKKVVKEEVDPTYDFVFKKELPMPETISKFASIKFGKELDPEVVAEIIKKDD